MHPRCNVLRGSVSAFVAAAFLAGSGMATVVWGTGQEGAAPNAQMKAVLDQLEALGGHPPHTLAPPEARKQPTPADAVVALLKKQGKSAAPEAVGKVENRDIKGPAGPIQTRVYWPSGSGPFPVILYIHGGGWVIADLDTYDSSARALTNAVGAVVVSTHYRQAPEHIFPAAHDDTWAAYEWVRANAASINGDPARIALAGESAGGNLAAAISMGARDRKVPMPVHQLLVYPITNYATDTTSYKENAMAKPLSKPLMEWFFEHYLSSPADGADPRVSPLRATNMHGLPPTTIITAQIDPLRSEGEEYATRLRKAGVDVEYRNFDGVTHEFFGMSAVVDDAKEAVQMAASRLKGAFATR